MDEQSWDRMYRSRGQVFSGNPNAVLTAEVAGLAPGRALDVGCGEGADALWLARRGWQVIAMDVSETALARAAAAGPDVVDHVTWTRADLVAVAPPADTFELVSVHYFPLPRQPDHVALRGLLASVVPGGTFLFVTHDIADLSSRPGFDPSRFYQPGEIAALLDDTWQLPVFDHRPRALPAPEGTRHTHDAILRVRRRS